MYQSYMYVQLLIRYFSETLIAINPGSQKCMYLCVYVVVLLVGFSLPPSLGPFLSPYLILSPALSASLTLIVINCLSFLRVLLSL